MKKIGRLESYGGGGHFIGEVNIEFDKFDNLPEEVRNNIGWSASNYLKKLQEQISMAWAKENEADKRNAHVAELTGLFELAGFDVIYVETVDSEYCKESCCYKFPWVIVTTKKGRIKLGWRKRVMNLDWSDSDLDIDGEELFKGEKTTTGTNYIHCWGEEKAVEYLKKLDEISGREFAKIEDAIASEKKHGGIKNLFGFWKKVDVTGSGCYQRTEGEYLIFVEAFVKAINQYEPWIASQYESASGFKKEHVGSGYMIGRYLSDGNSELYHHYHIISNICSKCFRQWDQPYHAAHCSCNAEPKEF